MFGRFTIVARTLGRPFFSQNQYFKYTKFNKYYKYNNYYKYYRYYTQKKHIVLMTFELSPFEILS